MCTLNYPDSQADEEKKNLHRQWQGKLYGPSFVMDRFYSIL